MSRDWTPKQLYLFDKQMNGELRKAKLTYEIEGKDYVLHDPEGKMEKAFPNLTFLGGDIFQKLKNESSGLFIVDVEIVLTGIIEILDSFKSPSIDINDSDIEANIKEKYWTLARLTRDWFEGKLDPGFYYNEWNNELFLTNLLEICKDSY